MRGANAFYFFRDGSIRKYQFTLRYIECVGVSDLLVKCQSRYSELQ